MKKAFVVSDIHGMFDEFQRLLKNWQQDDRLIILGDLIDRGPQSLQVVQYMMELSTKFNITLVKGNHDEMFLNFISNPQDCERFILNGGDATLKSFLQQEELHVSDFEQYALSIKEKYEKELNFLKDGKLYDEFGKVLFTHAGFSSTLDDWKETSDNDFVWIREHYKCKNRSGLVNVFGHTPTHYIHGQEIHDIWLSEDRTYIGIDGGCVFGGQLNAILIDEQGELLDTYREFPTSKFI